MTRLGMVLYHGINSGADLKEYAGIAEGAGYESLWVTERYFHEETFSLLGFLAAVTQDIKLGLGVTNPYTRNPALLAMASATLDRISGGRFMLGLGRSEGIVIRDRMGIPYSNPLSTMKEAVAIIGDLLAGERVTTTEGRFRLGNIHLETKPIQKKPPIYLAAMGPKALRLGVSRAHVTQILRLLRLAPGAQEAVSALGDPLDRNSPDGTRCLRKQYILGWHRLQDILKSAYVSRDERIELEFRG